MADGAMSQEQYEQMEADYQAITQEMNGEPSAKKFVVEYEKLYKQLKKVLTSEGRAWKLVETAKEKEEKARKIINDLKDEIARMKEGGATPAGEVEAVTVKETAEKAEAAEEGGKSNTMMIAVGAVAVAAIGAAAFLFMKKD